MTIKQKLTKEERDKKQSMLKIFEKGAQEMVLKTFEKGWS